MTSDDDVIQDAKGKDKQPSRDVAGLDCDDHGRPIIPDPAAMEGPAMAMAVREIITYHYRERPLACISWYNELIFLVGRASGNMKAKVPWKEIRENIERYIEPIFLPKGVKFNDPSHIVYLDCRSILQYWLNRQAQQVDTNSIFQFKAWQDPTTKTVQSALFSMPVVSLQPTKKKLKPAKKSAKGAGDDSDQSGWSTPDDCDWKVYEARGGLRVAVAGRGSANPTEEHQSSDEEQHSAQPRRPKKSGLNRTRAHSDSEEGAQPSNPPTSLVSDIQLHPVSQTPAIGSALLTPEPSDSPLAPAVDHISDAIASPARAKRKRAEEVDAANITQGTRTRTKTLKGLIGVMEKQTEGVVSRKDVNLDGGRKSKVDARSKASNQARSEDGVKRKKAPIKKR